MTNIRQPRRQVNKLPLFPPTDLGNAEMFASLYTDRLLYDHRRGRWFVWVPPRWKPDEDSTIERFGKRIPRERARSARNIGDPHTRHAEETWAQQSEHASRINALLSLAKSERGIAYDGSTWDQDGMLLTCTNGVVNLKTGKLRGPDPKLRISKLVNANYNPNEDCPTWKGALQNWWPGEPEIIDFVWRALGYSLTGFTTEQCFFCLFGDGSNGKSTFLSVIAHVLGDYAYPMPFPTLEFQTRSAISNDVAALVGRRFVWSSETQEDVRLNEGRIKALTGDSTITARFLYHEPFSFQPVGKFWLAFNHKPRIVDDSYAMWRRLRLIPFEQTFKAGGNRIKDLEGQLLSEADGILAWLVEGCLEWQRRGLDPPSRIVAETDRYKRECNGLDDFLDDCCLRDPTSTIPKADVFNAYLDWCKRGGERDALGRKGFSQRLLGMGFSDRSQTIKGQKVRVWNGIRLK